MCAKKGHGHVHSVPIKIESLEKSIELCSLKICSEAKGDALIPPDDSVFFCGGHTLNTLSLSLSQINPEKSLHIMN